MKNSFTKKMFIAFIIIFSISTTQSSAAPTEEIVKGFASYQADRIENIMLDNFLYDLGDKKLFKQFFPKTSGGLKQDFGISSKRLIPILTNNIEDDLINLKTFTNYLKENIKLEDNTNSDEINLSLQIISSLLKFKKGEVYTITKFIEEYSYINGKAVYIGETTDDLILTDTKNAVFNLEKIITDKVESHTNFFGYVSNTYIYKDINITNFLSVIKKTIEEDKNTNYIYMFLSVLDSLGFNVNENVAFKKFASASLFFASLTDLNSSENNSNEVSGIIKDFIDEDTAYKNKKQDVAMYTFRDNKPNLRCSNLFTCSNTWFIGSYYGASISEKENVRAFGPVGIEFKLLSFSKSTLTVMYAPIDIGIYITDELNDKEYEVNISDIQSNSYFLSLSSKRSPISFQIGVQEDVPIGKDLKEDKVFISISFDLTLFTIF